MKNSKIVTLLLIALAFPVISFCQIPEGFNYQAILRDDSNAEIPNTGITVKFQVLAGSASGVLVWEEEHVSTTNDIGLFNLVVGTGSKTGGTLDQFSDISWETDNYFLKVSIYYQNLWHDFTAGKMVSVPYAMTAKVSLDNPFTMSGDTVTLIDGSLSIGATNPGGSKVAIISQDDLSEDALFEVRRSDGQSVFAVYNNGVQINIPVDPLVKGPRGGFAIGGFDKTKGIVDQFMVINSDSTRIYIDDSALKGPRGGFAIGGFDKTKGYRQDYIFVAPDSTRVYVENQSKGPRGGFAIGGFDRTKGDVENFLDLTPENYFIGHKSGRGNVTGQYNSFVGYETGLSNYSGSANALFGFQAGYNNISGSSNLFLGYQSGYLNTDGSFNSFMGYLAGNSNTSGGQNSFLGSYAGVKNTTGSNNTFAGYLSGYSNIDGAANNFYGTGSGYSNTAGSNNVFIGPESGYLNTTGNYNAFIGYKSGYSNQANNNVFIGFESGMDNTTGDVNVFIGHAAGTSNTIGSGNVFLGNNAGEANDDGESNIFMGERSGFLNISGSHNVYIGYLSGYSATDAWGNVCIGYQSGHDLTLAYSNVFVGENTGRKTTWGEGNVFVGNQAGESNVTGSWNVHIGTGAGQYADADDNIFIGFGSGYETTTGGTNVFLGNQSGTNNISGNDNVYIGNGTGYSNIAGSGNIFIGKGAGWSETGSNKLYIDNTSTTTPLIYGDFTSNLVTVNGNLNVNSTSLRLVTDPGTGVTPTNYSYQGAAGSSAKQFAFAVRDALWVTGPSFLDSYLDIDVLSSGALRVSGDEAIWYDGTYFSWGYGGSYNYFADKVTIGNSGNFGYSLYVQGSAYSTGTWSTSDLRYKKDIEPIDDPVEKVLRMNGVSYLWKTGEYADKNLPEGRHYGVIAQEIEKILPEVVKTGSDGDRSVAYNELIPVLIEAIKEQQKIINDLKERVTGMESLLEINNR